MSGLINLCDGYKGGVGKSIVTMMMIEYYLAKNWDFIPVEADQYNPDVSNRYRNLDFKFTPFTEAGRRSSLANAEDPDEIVYCAAEHDVIVSLPAYVSNYFDQWLEVALDACDKAQVGIVRWFVTSGTYESLNFFKQALEKHGGGMTFVLVKNWGLCKDWRELEAFDGLAGLMDKYQVKTIDFPFLPWGITNQITRNSWKFSEARSNDNLSIVDTSRLIFFLEKTFTEFEGAGIFGLMLEKLSPTAI